ncbi:hypothetical protein ACKWTF_016106 [Chironomus riparius]
MDLILVKFQIDWTLHAVVLQSHKFCVPPEIRWQNIELFGSLIISVDTIWMEKLTIYECMTLSSYGWCHTFNIVDELEIIYKNSVAEYFQYQKMQVSNQAPNNTVKPPYFTFNKDSGFQATVLERKSSSFIKVK